jgi:hypothetical protein
MADAGYDADHLRHAIAAKVALAVAAYLLCRVDAS